MSDTAQRRDLGDRRTIETFAARVQTLERLKMLLVLTVCDIQAVGPGVWNGWKGELLRTLYWETEVVLAGGHSARERTWRVERAKAELREKLAQWTDLDFEAYAARHQQAYWLQGRPAAQDPSRQTPQHDGSRADRADHRHRNGCVSRGHRSSP